MIVKIGNIFESPAKTLVNTVNCVGVMGKGIAQEFKKRYPAMFEEYAQMCEAKAVRPGVPYLYSDLYGASILNFPTKDHWRSPSWLSYITAGLQWFRDNYEGLGITSIAFPPLGCGNGGLSWELVGPLMYSMLADLPIDIEIYAPYGTKPAHLTETYLSANAGNAPQEAKGLSRIPFNKYWLLLLYVVQRLNHDRYALSVGRTIFQKVCFVLTRTGIPTGFRFAEGHYGPYSAEVKDAILALSNANLMTEKSTGKMVETIVSPSFDLPKEEFTLDELLRAEKAIDLMSRVRNTDQAEMIATVLFSYDELLEKQTKVTDVQILEHVLKWKPRWQVEKSEEVVDAIVQLSMLGWISPGRSKRMPDFSDDLV